MLSKPEFIFILKKFSYFLTQMALLRVSSEKERWHNSIPLPISLVKEWQEPQSQIVREPSAWNWNHPYLEGFKMFITSRITAWNSARWPRPRFNISISSLNRTYLKGMTAFRNGGTPPAGKRAACLRPHKRGNHCYSGQRRSKTRTDLYHHLQISFCLKAVLWRPPNEYRQRFKISECCFSNIKDILSDTVSQTSSFHF